jgi:predicted O-methyltransferase YrrM
MEELVNIKPPPAVGKIWAASAELGFDMACDALTGSLLRSLAASKPGGRFLELGTGTGASTAWLLAGMDEAAQLTTVELEADYSRVAQKILGPDPRVNFVIENGTTFLFEHQSETFDLIFADTWPGKYWHLEPTLAMVKLGGFYLIDDMLPQENWPEDHAPKVAALIETLESREDFAITKLNWASGWVICTRRSAHN